MHVHACTCIQIYSIIDTKKMRHPAIVGFVWPLGCKKAHVLANSGRAKKQASTAVCIHLMEIPHIHMVNLASVLLLILLQYRLSVCIACALRAHCVHIAHAAARILTQEYLSPVY